MIILPITLTEWVCQIKILRRGVGNLTRRKGKLINLTVEMQFSTFTIAAIAITNSSTLAGAGANGS